jgi:hypothetical protein
LGKRRKLKGMIKGIREEKPVIEERSPDENV